MPHMLNYPPRMERKSDIASNNPLHLLRQYLFHKSSQVGISAIYFSDLLKNFVSASSRNVPFVFLVRLVHHFTVLLFLGWTQISTHSSPLICRIRKFSICFCLLTTSNLLSFENIDLEKPGSVPNKLKHTQICKIQGWTYPTSSSPA